MLDTHGYKCFTNVRDNIDTKFTILETDILKSTTQQSQGKEEVFARP